MTADHIPLHTCYPDAAAIFRRIYRSVEEIKETCLVVLDANVLLAPYNLSEEPLAQINSTYRNLVAQKRLLIPGQVAREFARHRSGKMGDLLKTVLDQISRQHKPMAAQFAFLKQLPEYEEALQIASTIEEKHKELIKKLQVVSEKIRTWETTDPVWNLYRELFTDSILELEQEKLNDIPRDLKFRTDHNIPPGYKDAHKADGGAGDLIIWKTMLQAGRHQERDIVFVTLDQKQDWWTQAAGGPLYPRLELLEEFSAATDGRTIRLLRFSEFLATFGAKDTVVQEVQRVEDEADVALDPEEEVPQRSAPRQVTHSRSHLPSKLAIEIDELRRIERIVIQEIMATYEQLEILRKRGGPASHINIVNQRIDSLNIRRRGIVRRLNILLEQSESEAGNAGENDPLF